MQRQFLRRCGSRREWTADSFVETTVRALKEEIGEGKVILGLSGGVDSSVAAVLLNRAIGERLTGIFVNHGLLRKHEFEDVLADYRGLGLNVIGVDASEQFLSALAGVDEPERKRKIIGSLFIEVFNAEAAKIPGVSFLAQGTIYPDRIESRNITGKVIKSHHNVGGLPEHMKLKLCEPLKWLFKDEVRAVGVMGDERTYDYAVVLLAVTSSDAMTADWASLPEGFMRNLSNEIINKVRGVNRVCYDISSKPPSTIEWE